MNCKYVICVMLIEIYIIEGGQKDVSALEGTTIRKKFGCAKSKSKDYFIEIKTVGQGHFSLLSL